MKKFIILVFLLLANQNFAQLKTHTFEEAEELCSKNPKPYFVFIQTSWCKFCKMMEKSTFKNEEIIRRLNENFYFISLNAETKDSIKFNNHTFKFKPKGKNLGIHELAEALSNQTYPTVTIINPEYTILSQIESFVNARQLLNYLSE